MTRRTAKSRRRRKTAPTWLRGALVALAVLAMAPPQGQAEPPGPGQAEILAEGRDLYDWHCANCHGSAGRGDGRMADVLVIPPADLTLIANRNSGVFPFWRTYQVVDGAKPVKGHETFQMPRFWERFQRDEGKPGYLPAHVRVLILTHFLESLQKP